MSKEKTNKGKGTTKDIGKRITHRTATEEDYKKMDFWNVGTFHRASTLQETEPPGGADKSQEKPPHCPQELVKTLRKQGHRVNLPGPLEERLQNDLMMEWWQGKHTKKK
jgi:hypothetical protein